MAQGKKPVSSGMPAWLFNALMGALAILVAFYMYAEWKHDKDLNDLCKRNGGELLSGKDGWFCVKKEALIDRKDAK